MKKLLLSRWTALITLMVCIFIFYQNPNFLQSVKLRYFDTLITSKKIQNNSSVVVVNIDDQTLKQYGQFPFPRSEYGKIIENLYNHKAGLVVFNVYMPDEDRFKQDDIFAQTLKKYAVILPQVGGIDKPNIQAFTPGFVNIGDDATKFTVNYPYIEPNVKIINDTAAGIGVANVFPEIDGVVRRMPMVISSQGKLYPNISLETLRVAAGDPSFQIKTDTTGIVAVRIPHYGKIQTDSIGRIWIDWSEKPTEYSYTKLPESFNNKIVIVGLTAKGLNNPVPTASGEQFPHIVQAAILNTIISGTNISRPSWSTVTELSITIFLCIITLFFARYTHGYISLLFVISCVYYGSHYVFNHYGYLIDITFPLFSIFVTFTHGYVVKFLSELKQKLQIKKQFGTYLSPTMVEKLQKSPELLTLGGESRELSIMFTDVRGFTSISEHYGKDVQGLTKIMNRYMTAMTSKIIDNNGTLDKYIGDAQMAFWNAPLDDPHHAKHAVKTALQMLGDLDEFNKDIAREGVPAFGMGLGINTDTVVVGNMGSSQRFDYTCLGDGVNLASRLEGQSKPYGVSMVIGTKTYEQVKDEYYCLELDCIAVKGKKEGVNIYTVLGKNDELKIDVADTQMHNAMLELYRQQKFDSCINFCNDLSNRFDGKMNKYYEMWIERCKEMKDQKLPSDWDGVYRATSK